MFFIKHTATTDIYTLSLHDALPIWVVGRDREQDIAVGARVDPASAGPRRDPAERSEEHTSELQSRGHLVCRLLLEKKKKRLKTIDNILNLRKDQDAAVKLCIK